jgi:hypothetical protein
MVKSRLVKFPIVSVLSMASAGTDGVVDGYYKKEGRCEDSGTSDGVMNLATGVIVGAYISFKTDKGNKDGSDEIDGNIVF